MSEDIGERNTCSSKYIDIQLSQTKADPEKCTVFLHGEDFLQIGNCCTVVKIKVNKAVIEWLEQNKANEPAELKLAHEDIDICTILWSSKDSLQNAWRVELKSEIHKDITVSYLTRLLEKLTSKNGKEVAKIAKEFYEKFNAKLEKVLSGSVMMQFSLPAQNYDDALKTVESLRETLETRLDGLIRSEDVRIPKQVVTRTASLKKIYRMCKGKSTSATKIQNAAESLFSKKFDLVHSDGSVRYNEFVSLLAFGCDGKIHIEQPFLPEFPREDSFNHIIDEVVGNDASWNVYTVLSVIFRIASDYGKIFYVDGYAIHPRIVFFTNGNFSETDALTKSTFIDAEIPTYPITFVQIDGTYPQDSLQKIISITQGEIRNDVGCISQYVKHQQNIIDVLKMEKKGLDEIDIDEILEKIKELSPNSVKDVETILKTLGGIQRKILGTGDVLPTEAVQFCS
ncbi:uncharacterized protein LOC128188027 isoform X2 [Crassostrea angulata]|uniref:uncharacterized protein LOC128188027 isoform X2 n=1 Tax=Magallana angulata TaxID=2784310 RepID=UPI0022B1D449|nr:uncharacterized protein LOC128188027 isoform X2 [Crassostrea angulata]